MAIWTQLHTKFSNCDVIVETWKLEIRMYKNPPGTNAVKCFASLYNHRIFKLSTVHFPYYLKRFKQNIREWALGIFYFNEQIQCFILRYFGSNLAVRAKLVYSFGS